MVPKVEKSEVVYQGYYNLRVDLLSLPERDPMTYTVLLAAKEAATILAKTADGRFVINREYRHPAESWLLGCPGGRVDPGESPLEAAKRELFEETGYRASSFRLMGTMHPLPAICDQKIHYFFAEDAHLFAPPSREPFELIETLLHTEEELLDAIRTGTAVDGILATALTLHRLSIP